MPVSSFYQQVLPSFLAADPKFESELHSLEGQITKSSLDDQIKCFYEIVQSEEDD